MDTKKVGNEMGPGTEGPQALIGREIAGYRLERVLGMGATGAVFLGQRTAEDAGKPAEVAIKILLLPWQMSADERSTFHSRFVREAETLKRMQHPNIVAVLDFGEQDGLTYMILPYLSGGTLATRLALGNRPLPEADRYVTQIASALDYAHSLGVVHRDIKPQNVLLDAEGNAHLSDFSIARLLEETRTKLTSTNRMLGTPAYIAPEQITTGRVSAASDIYSLGAVLFELVTGQVPFEADSLMEMLRKQSQDMPPLPRALRPDLPEPAEAVIWQALAKQPEARFASASDMARSFSDGLNGRWDSSVRPIAFAAPAFSTPGSLQWTNTVPSVPWSSQSPTQPRRRRSLAPIALGVIALTVVVVALAANFIGHTFKGNSSLPTGASTSNTSADVSSCLQQPNFDGSAGQPTTGSNFQDVNFPDATVSHFGNSFNDGFYQFQMVEVCTVTSSPDNVRSFYASNMPSNGWTQTDHFPYAGNPSRGCGDPYCWTKGASPTRFASLESVKSAGDDVVYELRLGLHP